MGLQYESNIEIIEFHDMIEFEAQEGDLEEIPDPVELNSLEFFIKALSYFEEEANVQLSLSGPSPAFLVSTREESSNSLLGETKDECSNMNLVFCTLEVNNIVGTNSRFSSEFQMSDTKFRWIKEIICKRDANDKRPKIVRKGLNLLLIFCSDQFIVNSRAPS